MEDRIDGAVTARAAIPSPDAADVCDLEASLAALLDELVSRESEYVSLDQELAAFRVAYSRRFGPLFAELDQIEAEIARIVAIRDATVEADRRADNARQRAQSSERLAHEAKAAPEPTPKRLVPQDVQAAYKRAAKRLHPDLAVDEADRQRRTVLMARLNVAREHADLATIEQLLRQEDTEASAPEQPAVGRRQQLQRQIEQIGGRLVELERLLAGMRADPMFALFEIQRRSPTGTDPFADDEADLTMRITTARTRLQKLAGDIS